MSDKMTTDHRSKTIWVFRTSATTLMDVRRLKPSLDSLMKKGDKWNFDLEDCDHILRVETRSLPASMIIETLERAGYTCAELHDNIAVGRLNGNLDATYFPEMKATVG